MSRARKILGKVNEVSGLKIKDILRRLDKVGLLRGNIIGGAAYAVLMDFKVPVVSDVDVMGFKPHITEVEFYDWLEVIEANPYTGAVDLVRDKKTKVNISYLGSDISFSDVSGADKPHINRYIRTAKYKVVNGFSVMTPEDFVDYLMFRGEEKEEERAKKIIQKYRLTFGSKKWVNRDNVIFLFGDLKKLGAGSEQEMKYLKKLRRSR